MDQNFIATHIRRTNRNLVILIVLMIGFSYILISSGRFTVLAQIPRAMNEGSILSIVDNLGLVILLFIGAAFLGLAVVLGFKLFIRIINIKFHPIHRAASIYGDF